MSEPNHSSPPPDAAVYKTLLESTKAIPWRIEWDSMSFSYIGPQIEDLLGWSQDSWRTIQDWQDRIHEDDRQKTVNFCVAQSESGIDHEADYRALTKDGNHIWIRDVVHVERDESGQVQALVGFMFDISERKKTEEELVRLKQELERLSYQDSLTNIGNRRMIDSIYDVEWNLAKRNRSPLTLVLIDIDYFKQYNDEYGHLCGDECLKQVSAILRSSVTRAKDFVGRFGGEEFILILPETDQRAALKVAQRCHERMLKAAIDHENSPHGSQVTFSIGIGTLVPSTVDCPQQFLESVDQALYKAKNLGRNRIEATEHMVSENADS